ncbi:MAG: dependent protein [Actinomycetota bacterium]|nr:dependent protein [Actinomycetota bacterium]
MTEDPRRDELAGRLAAVDRRVADACAAAGRARADVHLIAVTKTFPADDVARLVSLGVADVAENRDQEAAAKVARSASLGVTGVRWHFVGQLQTNKARSVAAYADVVHSLDRVRLVAALERAAGEHGRVIDALVQVDLGDGRDRGRGGAAPSGVPEVAAALAECDHLRLAGVMAVAPLEGAPGPAFARLADVAAEIRGTYPDATVVSAGMSGDLEVAVAHGATHLRVGRALLGSRPALG